MNITYDVTAKAFVIKALGGLRGVNCYFCGTPLNKDKHAGAVKLDGKLRHFCGSLICLLEMNDRTSAKD